MLPGDAEQTLLTLELGECTPVWLRCRSGKPQVVAQEEGEPLREMATRVTSHVARMLVERGRAPERAVLVCGPRDDAEVFVERALMACSILAAMLRGDGGRLVVVASTQDANAVAAFSAFADVLRQGVRGCPVTVTLRLDEIAPSVLPQGPRKARVGHSPRLRSLSGLGPVGSGSWRPGRH